MLADTLPVIPPKLVKRTLKGDFVDMVELLKDNIEADRRTLAVHTLMQRFDDQFQPEQKD